MGQQESPSAGSISFRKLDLVTTGPTNHPIGLSNFSTMPVAVRLIEFLTIASLFVLASTGAFILYFADKIFLLLAAILSPLLELMQLILMAMEYVFYWGTKHLISILVAIGSCGSTAVAANED